jgi:biopolymer transport protein TolR
MAFGRLERTPGSQPMSEINVTPLVDVMLVLVVILILTAPLMASSLRLDLPRSEAAQPGTAPRFVSIGIDRAGILFFNDQQVSREQLALRLASAARADPETEVQLRADQAVNYGTVVEIMGLAQQAGLNRIGFVAEASK